MDCFNNNLWMLKVQQTKSSWKCIFWVHFIATLKKKSIFYRHFNLFFGRNLPLTFQKNKKNNKNIKEEKTISTVSVFCIPPGRQYCCSIISSQVNNSLALIKSTLSLHEITFNFHCRMMAKDKRSVILHFFQYSW